MRFFVTCFVYLVVLHGAFGQARPGQNMVFNGSFDHPDDPLKGWTVNLEWLGNSHYMKNHTRIAAVESYKGYRNLAHINGKSKETKIESLPMKFEQGARYRCTIDVNGNTNPHIYFRGHKWQPGIRPHDEPTIPEMRTIYKSQFRGHKVQKGANGWKRITFEFPLEDLSSLAKKHLRYVRFFTVYAIVLADFPGEIYIDNVKVERIK